MPKERASAANISEIDGPLMPKQANHNLKPGDKVLLDKGIYGHVVVATVIESYQIGN